jgi:hypothetical protein
MAYTSLENVTKFKHLAKKIINQIYNIEYIKKIYIWKNAF